MAIWQPAQPAALAWSLGNKVVLHGSAQDRQPSDAGNASDAASRIGVGTNEIPTRRVKRACLGLQLHLNMRQAKKTTDHAEYVTFICIQGSTRIRDTYFYQHCKNHQGRPPLGRCVNNFWCTLVLDPPPLIQIECGRSQPLPTQIPAHSFHPRVPN